MKAPFGKRKAIVIMCLLMVLGFFTGTFMSGRRLERKIEDAFFNGTDGSGIGEASDMNIKAQSAMNLITVAKRYMEQDDELIKNADEACRANSAASDLQGKREANDLLGSSFTALYDAMDQLSLSEKDAKLRESLNADFQSAVNTMSHDPYNEEAMEYNRNIKRFPAGIIFSLMGMEPAPLFR